MVMPKYNKLVVFYPPFSYLSDVIIMYHSHLHSLPSKSFFCALYKYVYFQETFAFKSLLLSTLLDTLYVYSVEFMMYNIYLNEKNY